MPTLHQQLLGVWKLISYEERPIDGSAPSYPMGDTPAGLLIYSPDGYMSAQLMKLGRQPFASGSWLTGTPEEYRDEAANYVAYSGEFRVDAENSLVYHTMFVALFPNWIGQTQTRIVHLSSDDLTLSPPDPMLSGGRLVTAHLQWKRAIPSEAESLRA